MAEDSMITPEKSEFTLNEKELENVSGGAGCGEIGILNPDCSKTGVNMNCTEIGFANKDCTKAGLA